MRVLIEGKLYKLLVGVLTHSLQDLAYIVATGYVTASILLSGFYIRFRDFGLGFIRALSWANYQRYSFNAIARLELAGVTWAPEQCFLSSGASGQYQYFQIRTQARTLPLSVMHCLKQTSVHV